MSTTHAQSLMTHSLTGEAWVLSAARLSDAALPGMEEPLSAGVPASVPGCVHLDLLRAGLIEDPYQYRVEPRLYWIGRSDWRYVTSFEVDAQILERERIDLCCDGLDTVATVTVNGETVGETRNMHRRYRFDLRGRLAPGSNRLTIEFAAPLDAAEAAEAKYGSLPHQGHGGNELKPPHNMLRKMACNFGWDWGPALPTCGIWRDIRIEAWNTARLAAVTPQVIEATERRARIAVKVRGECASTPQLAGVKCTLLDPDGETVVGTTTTLDDRGIAETELLVEAPRRWWPRGYGDQPLYRLLTELAAPAGNACLDRKEATLGLRTVALDTSPDEQKGGGSKVDALPRGERMALRINGEPVFLKGANWIPDDCFATRAEEPERIERRLAQAVDLNMNALRVWGGGIYVNHAMMDACDRAGVLVWHDFLFACAAYPEEQPYRSEVDAEARDNVERLASHPSLVLWNGCNENIWGTFDWGESWKSLRTEGKRTWGEGYYLELLPRVVREVAVATPYWAGSPYSGSMDRHPNANEYGNRHIWDVWHGDGQYRNYLGHFPRLTSEFGYHGPPCFATLDAVMPDDPEQRRWDSPVMEFFNRNGGRGGQSHTDLRLRDDFDPPEGDFDAWLYLAQVMQARALEMGCTWFRALWPWCSGATYWQLNDCWPVSSWAAIDGRGRLKPMAYATRRFFQPRLVTIKPTRPASPGEANDSLAAYLHNDTGVPWTGRLTVRRVDLRGRTLDAAEHAFDCPPRQVQRFEIPETWSDRPRDSALVAEADHVGDADAADPLGVPAYARRGWWWFAPDRELAYEPPRFDTTLEPAAGGHRLTITAKTLLRDLCVFADRLDPAATVSDNCITLLPDETASLVIAAEQPLDRDALTSPPVLQSVNHYATQTLEA